MPNTPEFGRCVSVRQNMDRREGGGEGEVGEGMHYISTVSPIFPHKLSKQNVKMFTVRPIKGVPRRPSPLSWFISSFTYLSFETNFGQTTCKGRRPYSPEHEKVWPIFTYFVTNNPYFFFLCRDPIFLQISKWKYIFIFLTSLLK